MGGFADGDAVQVDVSSTTSTSHRSVQRSLRSPPSVISSVADDDASPSFHPFTRLLRTPYIHIADLSAPPQYDPASLQYMLDFFRNVAQSIPDAGGSADASDGVVPLDPSARDDNNRRAGIIVLREDLDFYVIPHKKSIGPTEMVEVKRAAAKALLRQDGIFSGLKRSDEPGTTEAHLIEMLTAG
jgi:hypothetical protein